MTPDRARELLGGLASGILTPEERESLFEAALHDQSLFNEVADELEFAAFLQSPDTRAQLANRIEVEPGRRRRWTLRPSWLALAGVFAASTVLIVVLWHGPGRVASERAPLDAAVPVTSEQLKTEQDQANAQQASPRPANAPARQAAPGEQARATRLKDIAAEKALEEAKTRRQLAANSPPPTQQALGAAVAPTRGSPEPPATRDADESKPRADATVPAPRPAPAAPPAAPPATDEARNRAAPRISAPDMAPRTTFAATLPKATASLEGTVHDLAGGAVRNATIDIVNTATNITTHTSSDAAGRFVAPLLPAGGPYTVIAQANGFKKEQRTGIVLAANQRPQIDIPLQIGASSQVVEVTTETALLATSVSQLAGSSQSSGKQVAVLDFVNRTPQTQSGQQAADLLSSQLLGSGQVRVIDREKVQQAAQMKSKSRTPSNKEAAALGRRIGADAVIVGSVKSSSPAGNSDVALTAQVIDTRKARPMAEAVASGTSLQGATNQLGLALQSKLAQPLEGTITRVDQDTVSVSFKAPSQGRIGARLEVFRGKRKIGELTLTSVYGQSAAGKFSGTGQPRSGDRVASPR